MIKFKITGDMRMIANSAWISTTDEIKTKNRTDEDVSRVVRFLAKNMHTSPFESVTICGMMDEEVPSFISSNNFVRVSKEKNTFVTDLLNFAKIMHKEGFQNQVWKEFCDQNEELSSVVKLFDFNFEYSPYEKDLSNFFEQIEVELINYHEGEDESMSRATWRIKCPLSISVQLLRHRSGSFNQVSGRYKTIRQEAFAIPKDVKDISNRVDYLDSSFQKMNFSMEENRKDYLEIMKQLKMAQNNEIINNDEYKRLREVTRFMLPEGRMTELYVSMYMDDFFHYLKLRDSSHAQLEHIALAQLMKKALFKI